MPTLLLLLMLLICGTIAAGAAITLMAWGLIHPPRMTDGKAIALLHRLSPGDTGLPFEPMTFPLRDERGRPMNLAAWWIPAPCDSPRCVILLHGYADAKVGALAWAPMFHDARCHILALDLRAHGDSDGDFTTAGFHERRDLAQILGQLKAARPSATRQFILFGASTGAAVALAAAADHPHDIAALVLDSPYADFRHTAMANYDRLGLPGRSIQSLAVRVAQLLTHCRYADVAPPKLLAQVPAPVLMILPDSDPIVSDEDRARLRKALVDRSNLLDDLWLVPNCPHLVALQTDPAEYARRLKEFLGSIDVGGKSRKFQEVSKQNAESS